MGMQHLHSLGWIHNDINPKNIMLDEDDTTIIIDFDSCCGMNEKGPTCGTHMWTDETYDADCAKLENDYCGLRKIRQWIQDPGPFCWSSRDDKNLHEQQGHHGQLGEHCFLCRAR